MWLCVLCAQEVGIESLFAMAFVFLLRKLLLSSFHTSWLLGLNASGKTSLQAQARVEFLVALACSREFVVEQ